MNNLQEKLKALRKEKGISQEKLADYLGVTFQAVSKWETGSTMPDITLLPDIARFFDITVDELLCVEAVDKNRLYAEFENKAEKLFRDGRYSEMLEIWKEAYHLLPNDIRVKEMLMSAYYDADKVRFHKEIEELGNEIFSESADSYYRGQVIREMSVTYAACGNMHLAEKWAAKAGMIHQTREKILSEIHSGNELLQDISFYTFWSFDNLFYMTVKAVCDGILSRKESFETAETAAKLFEVIYKNDDAGFETIRQMFRLHILAAEYSDNEKSAEYHLTRAFELAVRSSKVSGHILDLPLLYGWEIQGAPDNNLSIAKAMLNEMQESKEYLLWRNTDWFRKIMEELKKVIE
ncbi:MAG: helix-turn-helix transcriptional regulator [Oscillospiraceae bacterium]|nr:helix-turn-helix transcriptional regulator [Oscillospiraceae bacterium]